MGEREKQTESKKKEEGKQQIALSIYGKPEWPWWWW